MRVAISTYEDKESKDMIDKAGASLVRHRYSYHNRYRNDRRSLFKCLCHIQLMVLLGASLMMISLSDARASLSPGWTPYMTIQNVIVNSDQAILIIQGGISTTYLRDDCNASPYNVIDLTTPGGRSTLAMALIAYTSDRQVSLALQACNAGRPEITHIQL